MRSWGPKLLPLITILLFFVFFLITPETIIAKSGCCSSHGGVNCAAGPQANGNVICNDGWRGSSCSYAGMVMCGGSSTTTAPIITPTPSPLKTPTPTPKHTFTSTPTPTPTPTSTAEPTGGVKATETEAPLPTSTGIPSPTPTSAVKGDKAQGAATLGLVFLAIFVGLPLWILYKYRGVLKERYFKKG